ncbi:MAG: DoxX family protein [Patescibacteria group bacterium]
MIQKNHDLAVLLVRVTVGAVFIAHGVQKLGALGMVGGFFTSLGLPAVLATVVAVVEVAAGVAVLLGIATRIAALGIAVIMVGAIFFVKFSLGFLGGYEFELVLLLIALSLVASGPGRYSVMPNSTL